MKPQPGAEIYSVINQEEKLVAVYHDRKQRFIPATEKQ